MSEFEEMYTIYQKDVYYFLLKLTGYKEMLAEELTQETFYQAILSLKRFRGECTLKSWLCQIAKNTYYRYLREHVKHSNLTSKLSLEPEIKSVSAVIEEKDTISHIREVIGQLDEKSRSIVEYRLFCQIPFKEIGCLLGIREATAKVLFCRAKEKIQKGLREDYGYEI
ncbi:MAG TPA: sigma-70 family RNA polymerase sigma factor [Lachnospiraceae bacterium]|nr:sigma-70 family RNA polymerase sigma factor [Lachnospiraceae bacterium]